MDELFSKMRVEDMGRSDDSRLLEGGIFKTLFLKHSPLVIDGIFPALQNRLACPDFQEEFLRQFRKKINLERDQLLTEVDKCVVAGNDALFYSRQLPSLDRKLAIGSLDGYLKFLRNPEERHDEIIDLLAQDYAQQHAGNNGTDYVKEYYHLYQIGSFLYERYLAKLSVFESFEKPCAEKLISLYRERLDIDLKAADPQFGRYGLLSMGSEFSIFNSKESRTIVDDRIGQHFWIDVPRELLTAIENAMDKHWVTHIAFDIGLITEVTPAFEAMEFGSLFSFQALQLPPVSKLYDEECYEDALWVKVSTNPYSMTFEELCSDFPTLDGNVVTQLVHLEFFLDQGHYFISHLDHEYILYAVDAYERRRYEAGVKGQKKRKTFKIDKARIPFDFSCGDRYFLFLVLDSYFKNKSLIREYFSSVSQRCEGSCRNR